MRYKIVFGLATLVVLFDQFTKWLVVEHISALEEIKLTSFFSLVHVRNTGAAFGVFSDPSTTWQFWLFAAATVLATAVVIFMTKQAEEREKLLFVSLGLILGGAIGNFIDRVRFREVIDFLDFYLAGWHWPAFNVADIAICLGAFLTAILLFNQKQPEKKQ